jgi:hypothetical protein
MDKIILPSAHHGSKVPYLKAQIRPYGDGHLRLQLVGATKSATSEHDFNVDATTYKWIEKWYNTSLAKKGIKS